MDSSDKKINVYLKIMKTVALEVKESERIENLKAMLHAKEGISEDIQDIFFSGDRLRDEQRLIDYGIQNNSTLHLVLQNSTRMKLHVKIPSRQKTIVVEALVYHTVRHIKSLIQLKEGIQSDEFALLYDGKVLEEDLTLAALSIKSESTLHLIIFPKRVLSISVKAPNGDIMKLKVEALFTVHDLKTILEDMMGLSVSNHNIFYAGRKLEDDKTLAYYDIKDKYILEVISQFQIFVKTWYGKTVGLDVQLSNTIKDVIHKLSSKLQIPDHVRIIILYAGKQLVPERDLASYKIQRNSTFHMVFSAPISKLVKLKLTKLSHRVSESTTISCLKEMAQVIYPNPIKELLFGDTLLQDECSLADYGIAFDAEVTVCFEA